MSDFKQAIEWMKEGKKVYCLGNKKVLYQISNDDFDRDICFRAVEATDWEIYEDNWNLLSNSLFGTCNVKTDMCSEDKFDANNVVELKEKISEDIKDLWINGEFILGNVDKILTKRFGF